MHQFREGWQYKQMCDRGVVPSQQNQQREERGEQEEGVGHDQSMENQFFESLDCSKISFFNQSDSKKSDIPPKERLKILINKKRQTLAALQTLQDEEESLKAKMNPVRTKPKKHRVVSTQTQDNKSLIKQLIHQSKVFQTSIINKIKSVEQKKKEELMRQKEEEIRKLSQLKEQRQARAEEKIRRIKERQTERLDNNKKSRERTKELHSKSYIFERFKTEQQSEKKTISPIKKQVATINEILEHQKRYKSLTREDSQQRRENMKCFRKEFNKRSSKKYPEGRIAGIIREEKVEEKKKEMEKKAFAERYMNRVSEYGKIVRELYHPRVKERERTEASESKGTTGLKRKKETRSVEELKELGDNYLAYNKVHRAKKSLDINIETRDPKQSRIKYKDYLKELKPRVVSENFSLRFESMMRQEKSPDRILKLRTLLRNEEEKYPEPNQHKLKELTNAKLAILESIL